MTHKQVIVMRTDLNMRKGKIAAQAGHAVAAVILDLAKTKLGFKDPRAKPWLEGKFKKICVQIDSEQKLLDVVELAKSRGILTSLITDAGLTEFGGVPTVTCAAIGPDTEENINQITGNLKLY